MTCAWWTVVTTQEEKIALRGQFSQASAEREKNGNNDPKLKFQRPKATTQVLHR